MTKKRIRLLRSNENMAYLLSKDEWDVVEVMDHWCFVYDRMPRKMKMIVDLKITGLNNKAISRKVKCSVTSVCNHLLKAKKRILRGENVL